VAVGGSGVAVAVGVKVAVGVGVDARGVSGRGDAADAAETWVRSAATSSRSARRSSLSPPQAASMGAAKNTAMTKRMVRIVRSALKARKGNGCADAAWRCDGVAVPTSEARQRF